MTKNLTSLADLDPNPLIDLTFFSYKETITLEDANKIVGKMAGRHFSLILMEATLEEGALQTILQGLFSIHSAKHISFINCGLGDRDVVPLADLLKDKPINTMYLYGNEIGDEGAKALATALKVSQVDLHLDDNLIGPSGAVELVKAWSSRGDTSIILSNNCLGNEGAKKVAQTIAEFPGQIDSIDLVGNEIDAEGDAALAQYLPASVTKVVYRTQELDFEAYIKAFALGALLDLLEYHDDHSPAEKTYSIDKIGLDHPRAYPPVKQVVEDENYKIRNERIRAVWLDLIALLGY